jgi:hypothetical protein
VVGASGITVSKGLGSGRTYRWEEIRWIDVREGAAQGGTFRYARITLANGRRRTLPALQQSPLYPDPEFDADFQRVVNWWESSTESTSRFRPPEKAWQRMEPGRLGTILGVVISIVIIVVVFLVKT